MPHDAISVFDMFKIGVGPSSSHTLGPWKAAQKVINGLNKKGLLSQITRLEVLLYGSLAKTGKGHGTDVAVMMGLCNYYPETIDVSTLKAKVAALHVVKQLPVGGVFIPFDPATDLQFLYNESLPFHPNALSFLITLKNGDNICETWYSIGGGFVVQEGVSDFEGAYP